MLRFARRRPTEGTLVYQAAAKVCNRCPVKAKCTTSHTGRQIHRSVFQPYLNRAKAYRETWAYKKAMRKRQVWPEPLFGEAKQYHGLHRFRLRGVLKVNGEGLMIAAGQNLKRLLTYEGWGKRQGPPGWGAAVALAPAFSLA